MLPTDWVGRGGGTRWRRLAKSRRSPGGARHWPDLRPLTSRTRQPITLMPSFVSPATDGLKTLRVNQPGCWKPLDGGVVGGSMALIGAIVACPPERRES